MRLVFVLFQAWVFEMHLCNLTLTRFETLQIETFCKRLQWCFSLAEASQGGVRLPIVCRIQYNDLLKKNTLFQIASLERGVRLPVVCPGVWGLAPKSTDYNTYTHMYVRVYTYARV